MAFVTAAKAAGWVATELGRSMTNREHRREVFDRLNDIRRLFYSAYQKVRLNFHIDLCFEVSEFYEECPTCGTAPATYAGFSLPQCVETVEQAWISGIPLKIYNRWYEYKSGIQGSGNTTKLVDMGDNFPLPISWKTGTCEKLRFMAQSEKDCGKLARVTLVNSEGSNVTEEIPLTLAGSCTAGSALDLMRPGGIILPSDMVGGVTVSGETGSVYGELAPGIEIPTFRRMKVPGACCGQIIQVSATRRFAEVHFDWEIIETDNKLAILEAHRYLKIMEVNSSDAQWIAKANMHLRNMVELIAGTNAKNEGASTVRRLDLIPEKTRRTGLIANRRGFR